MVEQNQEGPIRRGTCRIHVQHVLEFVIPVHHGVFVDIQFFRSLRQIEIGLDESSHRLDELPSILLLYICRKQA